jgi:hypothetical protein
MSAAELRKAAETLRHLTTQATEGPWVQHPGARQLIVTADGTEVVARQCAVANAPYVARMHPGVGLALADWLDDIAAGWMWDDEEPGVVDFDGDRLTFEESLDTRALTLARLINGGAS